jgi:hypothetical protein
MILELILISLSFTLGFASESLVNKIMKEYEEKKENEKHKHHWHF